MIRMKIAFVLRMIDDFSGSCINEKVFTFAVNGRVVHPVEKDEGLYVFLEPYEACTRVWIESAFYHSCSVMIDKRALNPAEPVAEVRLYAKSGRALLRAGGLYTGVYKEGKEFPLEVYAKKSSTPGLIVREYRNIEGGHWWLFQDLRKKHFLEKHGF